MNTIEYSEQLINEIHHRLEESERTAEEQIERAQNQLEEHRNHAQEQIERIHNQIHQETESAGEEIRRLHEGLEQYRRNVQEQIQKIQEESGEYHRNIEEQTERIHAQIQQAKENVEKQVESIREQIEHSEKNSQEQIEQMRNRTEKHKHNANEQVEKIREQIEKYRGTTDNHSERIHNETRTSVEQHNKTNTAQSLVERFDTQYNERHAATTVSNSYVVNGVEILQYSGKLLPLTEMDTFYSRNEWLQIFLNNSVPIENLDDYCCYLNERDMLMRIQQKPDVWTSGLFDIPPTDNWETYKEAYINRLTNID